MRALILLLTAGVACSSKAPAPAADDGKRAPPPVAIDAAPPPIDAAAAFEIRERAESYETFVDVAPRGADCPKLDWRRKAKTVSIVRCRGGAFADQVPVLRDMVAYVRATDRTFDDARLLGNLDFLAYPEFAQRLVAYAQKTPYDPKQGLHAYVVAAAGSEDMLPELATIFDAKRVRLRSVEKCSAGRPTTKGEIGDFVRAQGVKGNREVPVGCLMAWFDIER
ncbi:MAG TPA: hypothetical protein VFQ53_38600 [Kofleriaceae bacterium]|nr:hypothetical protein [Kofleriaceae bacterium]